MERDGYPCGGAASRPCDAARGPLYAWDRLGASNRPCALASPLEEMDCESWIENGTWQMAYARGRDGGCDEETGSGGSLEERGYGGLRDHGGFLVVKASVDEGLWSGACPREVG